MLTPIIKFVAAAIKTHPNSKLDDRYQTYANLRNNLFEHGGSIMLCNLCQQEQMSAHYKTMGLRVNSSWSKYLEMIMRSPHPSLGFFLYEHPLCCGMFGHDFSTYLACQDSNFRSIHLSFYKDESFEFTADGKPTVRTFISFGQSKKYFSFKKRIGANDSSIRNYINENVISLYKRADNPKEALMKLKIRGSNPSLSESMAFCTDSKLHAASAYILQDKVILQSKGMFTAKHDHKTFFEIERSIVKVEGDCNWMFPYSGFYESVLGLLKRYSNSSLGAYTYRRSVSNKLYIATDSILRSVTLMQVVKRKWFKLPDIKGTRHTHTVVLSFYKQKFSWLRDDVRSTLEASPFDNHLSLHNFILSVSAKNRSVRTYAPSNVVSSSMDIVRSMVENCQWRGRKLNYVTVYTVADAGDAMKMLTERVWRCLRAPCVEDKTDMVQEILQCSIDPFASSKLDRRMHELSRSQIAMSVLARTLR